MKKKILIVEDEETLLSLESILLTSKGYEVKGVMDGPAALEAVVSTKPRGDGWSGSIGSGGKHQT